MFLAIDIGNTNIDFGLFEQGVLKGSFKIPSVGAATVEEIGAAASQMIIFHAGIDFTIERAAICSVVPELTEKLQNAAKKYFNVEPQLLTADIKTSFKIGYKDPRQLGTDRLANVIAVRKLYGYPALVIDLGTANKYELIDSNGDYMGGLIAPGVGVAAWGLAQKAAQLYPVPIEKPIHLVADNTTDALKSGLYYSLIGQVGYIADLLIARLESHDCRLILTGGFAEIVSHELSLPFILDSSLTLKGLQIIFDN